MTVTRGMIGTVAITAMLGVGVLAPSPAWTQAPSGRLQQVEKQLADKQGAIEAHRKQMEGVKDPQALNTEMRKHFQMTEDALALMLERRKLMDAKAPNTGTQAPQTAAPPQGGGMERGMQGGMMQKEMSGGMMQKEMRGTQGMGGGMMEKEMGGMQDGATPVPGMGSASPSTTPGTSSTPMADMEQMMKRIAEHSTYMDTVNDPRTFQQEMLRHQKMLDQMMQLMQR